MSCGREVGGGGGGATEEEKEKEKEGGAGSQRSKTKTPHKDVGKKQDFTNEHWKYSNKSWWFCHQNHD